MAVTLVHVCIECRSIQSEQYMNNNVHGAMGRCQYCKGRVVRTREDRVQNTIARANNDRGFGLLDEEPEG